MGKIANKEEGKNKKGVIIMAVCVVLSIAIIIGCVFFPEEFFGFFIK